MTTITFDKKLNLTKNHFKDLDDFQMYLIENKYQNYELTEEQSLLMEKREIYMKKHPEEIFSKTEVFKSIKRNENLK